MYYVVYKVNPDDCMGDRVKIFKCDNIQVAISFYKDFFIEDEKTVNELFNLFWDKEAIEDDSRLNVIGEVFICRTHILLDIIPGLTFDGKAVEYGVWINDFDNLAFNHECIDLMEYFENNNIETLCSYTFQLVVSEDCSFSCEKARFDCEKSLLNITKRVEMLSALGKLKFALIWPGNWKDVGFTEREIWVNNKGYGYIGCDEPTQRWEGPGVGHEKWQIIKEKIVNKTVSYEDIKDTSFVDLLNTMYFEYDFKDQDQLIYDLSKLASTDYPEDYFYAMAVLFSGFDCFGSEEALNAEYERDWADELWEDMDDELLEEWINRLKHEDNPALIEWAENAL